MPAGGKYLLLLSNAPHISLTGAPTSRENKDSEEIPSAEDDKILGDETAEVYEGRPKKRHKFDNAAARANKRAQQIKVQTEVQAVTTAYLDAFVKNDEAAAQWLAQKAKTWLGDSAELVSK
jgi:hypothetical protein